jgi:pimeloyl-ACP methyl ester carboxylesterase
VSASLSRRAILLGAGGVALAGCGSSLRVSDDLALSSGTFISARMNGRRIGWSVAAPKAHRGSSLPVVISLHGRGGDHRSTFDQLGLAEVLSRAIKTGTPPFALASVDGGDHGYWHRRADGTDAGAMVREEFVPLLGDRGLDAGRISLYGWSMGGYGALLLAGKGMKVRAVAASSPALFTSAGGTPAGAYDSAEDYLRNDVYAFPEWLRAVPVHLDCGRQDPFYLATRDYARRLPDRPRTSFPDGKHEASYWHRAAAGSFGFLAERLA